ncbi:MAG: ParB/RepB/Spo0J family partition protein [Bacilli bacterium]|jgi:ParB family chromosome partitioning protein|nr:ParB/RepB/Spo0J family partition protein [Bacilli bacterium]MDD3069075.1 ParB/RepB/Spo0J family partition protein [Bacilli bacterium]MDD3841230.1 ParB/RepB/Spo0J family partition protein [Bacilli bacterium]HKM10003.1 ParB/RepB/Spo0J family partition protein [Bacilli bacterium]
MKKDNSSKILRSSLSTLMKRFSSTDIISSLEKEYSSSTPGYIRVGLIDDNPILKKARINEQQLEIIINQVKEKGIASPLLVIGREDRYEILYPRIYYIAALKLKLETIPCSIVKIEEEDMLVFLAKRLEEDKNSNIVEMSLILNRLQKRYHFTQSEIAEMMQQSRSQITNITRLIKMPDFVLRDISNNILSFGHARALSTLSIENIKKTLPIIYRDKLSVREVERLVYSMKKSPSLLEEERKIKALLNCQASISPKTISLRFETEEEREKFINSLTFNNV